MREFLGVQHYSNVWDFLFADMMISEAGSLESLANCAGKLAKYDSILLILNTDTLIVCKCFNLGAHNNSVHEDGKPEKKKELTEVRHLSLLFQFCCFGG